MKVILLVAAIGGLAGFIRSADQKPGVRAVNSLLGALVGLMLAGVVLKIFVD